MEKNILTLSKKELKDMLLNNNIAQPKAKYSNNVLLNMLDSVKSDFTIKVEKTKSLNMVNRGSVAEILFKLLLNQALNTNVVKSDKSQAYSSDLDTSNINTQLLEKFGLPKSKNIEIKFSTSFATASPKNNNARYIIVISESGLSLVSSKNVMFDSKNHVARYQPYGETLRVLEKTMGWA